MKLGMSILNFLFVNKMQNIAQHSRNQDATLYVTNLDEKVNETLLWELMVQAGPVVNVYIPKDRISSQHSNYGFVEFATEEDAEYAVKVMNLVKMYGKAIRCVKSTQERGKFDIGATIFVGNLTPEVDERLLSDTFSSFGTLVEAPKISRDDGGGHRGFGFVSYDSFESADAAISAMNGQWLANKQISVSYAFKKDGRGERHGSAAERLLAAQAKKLKMEKAMAQVV